jgi:hypothetical protein
MPISTINTNSIADDVFQANKNLIINGAMQVAQRGTSVAGITAGGYKALDRFDIDLSSAGTWTISQDTDVPAGFGSSMKFLCTAADASLGSTDRIAFRQKFEGQDLQQLKKGTTAAKTFTVSFYVKSNKTGTYILEFYDLNNSRHINKSYTIISAATWEYKTITFDADTNGAFNNDPNASAQLQFWLGAGSAYTSGSLQTSWGANVTANRAVGNVNLADSTSNEWQITGVQLEVGEQATPFEHRSYGEELMLCGRYYQKSGASQWMYPISTGNNGYRRTPVKFVPQLRATPTLTSTNIGSPTGFGPQHSSPVGTDFYADGMGDTGYLTMTWTADAEI